MLHLSMYTCIVYIVFDPQGVQLGNAATTTDNDNDNGGVFQPPFSNDPKAHTFPA